MACSAVLRSCVWQAELGDAQARGLWVLRAENEAITGSCARSKASVRSGINCWKDFALGFLGLERPYPAPLYGLLAWSKTFRCG